MQFPRAVFITGTDTNVGKSVVCAVLCKALNAGYWKPVQSGTIEGTDKATVQSLTGFSGDYFYPETYSLKQPLSPHSAAALEQVHIDMRQITVPEFKQRHLVVEGAGGVLVPLNDRDLMVDLINQLQLPTIVVARSTLGTINHTLLTLQALRGAGVQVLGVILNGELNPRNADAIRSFGNTRILGQVEQISPLTASGISLASRKLFNELNNELPYLASVHTDENSGLTAPGAESARLVH